MFLAWSGHPGTPRTAIATPRTQAAGFRRREEEAAAPSPVADDINIVYNAEVDNPIDDPAPYLRPPTSPLLRSPRGRSSLPGGGSYSPRTPPLRTPRGRSSLPGGERDSPRTSTCPPVSSLPMWFNRGEGSPCTSWAPSPTWSQTQEAVFRDFGAGVPAHFGDSHSVFRQMSTVVVTKPTRAPFDFSGSGAVDRVGNPATAPFPRGPYNGSYAPPPPPSPRGPYNGNYAPPPPPPAPLPTVRAVWMPANPLPVAAVDPVGNPATAPSLQGPCNANNPASPLPPVTQAWMLIDRAPVAPVLQLADLACVDEALGANRARGLPTVSNDLFGCQQSPAVVNPALLPQPYVSNNCEPNPADVAMPRFVTPTPVINTPDQTPPTEWLRAD